MSQHTKTYEVVIHAKTHKTAVYNAHAVIVQADNKKDAIQQASQPFYSVQKSVSVYPAQLIKK